MRPDTEGTLFRQGRVNRSLLLIFPRLPTLQIDAGLESTEWVDERKAYDIDS